MSGINRPVAAAERTGGAAVVVGGGIAGLAAAAALGGAGWRVTVLEQAPVFWEAGAGLTLTPNGLRALAGLGIEGAVRDAGWALRPDGVMGSRGERLVRFSSRVRAMPVVGIHRRSLHGVLVDAASAVVDLRPGCRVLGMDIGAPGGRPARVRWREGGADHVMAADLLVGADGVNSTVRQRVAPAVDVRPSGFAAWRAVVPDVGSGPDWTAWWGDGAEFGAQRIGPDRVSWHCLFRVDAAARLDEGGRGLDEFIAGWPSQVLDLVSRSDPERILRHDISVARGEFVHSSRDEPCSSGMRLTRFCRRSARVRTSPSRTGSPSATWCAGRPSTRHCGAMTPFGLPAHAGSRRVRAPCRGSVRDAHADWDRPFATGSSNGCRRKPSSAASPGSRSGTCRWGEGGATACARLTRLAKWKRLPYA